MEKIKIYKLYEIFKKQVFIFKKYKTLDYEKNLYVNGVYDEYGILTYETNENEVYLEFSRNHPSENGIKNENPSLYLIIQKNSDIIFELIFEDNKANIMLNEQINLPELSLFPEIAKYASSYERLRRK